jgi:hypothetical protein
MIDPASCLSAELGPMGPRVGEWVRECRELWEAAPADPPPLGKIYAGREKKAFERELSTIVEQVTERGNASPAQSPASSPDKLEETIAALRPSGQRLLGLMELPLGSIYDERFVDSTRRFLAAARAFDPALGLDSVYQALRNVWIMNTLQLEMGIEVEHTDAVFGYSMVYPYLDNLLDDNSTAVREKLATLDKLRAWLEGKPAKPGGPREEKLRALVAKVEGRFPRAGHPGVYSSMLAIYNAQIRSLLQQRGQGANDILAISFEKGGTSVLADGYLVAGRLDPDQERFCFGFGAFLQLADDLQDVEEDARRGHMTVFSQAAVRGKTLDLLLFKYLRFIAAILERNPGRGRPGDAALRAVMLRACTLMALESAGKCRDRFGRKALRLCQASFPARFSYLRKLRLKLEDRVAQSPLTIADADPVLTAFLSLSSRALSF